MCLLSVTLLARGRGTCTEVSHARPRLCSAFIFSELCAYPPGVNRRTQRKCIAIVERITFSLWNQTGGSTPRSPWEGSTCPIIHDCSNRRLPARHGSMEDV